VAVWLVTNTFTLLEFFQNSPELKLPVAQQIEYLAYTSYINWAAGLLLMVILIAPPFHTVRQRIWPGWLVGGGFIFMLAMASWPDSRALPLGVVLSALIGVGSVVSMNWIGNRISVIQYPFTWALGNLVGLIVVLAGISLKAPLEHGFNLRGLFFLFLVMVLFAALPMFLATKPRRLWLVPSCVLLSLIIMVLWFVTPLRHVNGRDSLPNVILISVDTLRRDHLGIYGNEIVKTPHIDSLGERCVVFDQAVTSIPVTYPSHLTMLTGKHPGNHGVLWNGPMGFRSEVDFLPKVLRKSGYKTAAFVGGFTLQRNCCSLDEFFEVYDDYLGQYETMPNLYLDHIVLQLLNPFLKIVDKAFSSSTDDKPAEHVISAASEWLEANADGPFFLFVHLFDPHGPYAPPAPYVKMYDSDYQGNTDGDWYGMSSEERERIIANPREQDHLTALYKGEITYTDAQIGNFLTIVDQLELWDNTLVIVTADHGESLTEHDYYFDHTYDLYDPSLRIPLIFRFPDGVEHSRRRIDHTVQLVDLFPSDFAM